LRRDTIKKSLSPRTSDFHNEVKKKGVKILGKDNAKGEYVDMIASVKSKMKHQDYVDHKEEKRNLKSANSMANPRWALKGNFVRNSTEEGLPN
jgi:hypothetical protein